MGISPMGPQINLGDLARGIGNKVNQFATWAADTTGINGAKQVDPYQFNWADYGQDRASQLALLNQYQQMAAGNGPSLAQGQLQQATDQNIRQAMALGQAQQGQGLGYASALRNIADQSAAARQQSAGQSALLRNYEQMQAMGAQGSLLGQLQGQNFQQQGMQSANAYNYAGLNANIQNQNAANRRQFFGGIANGLGSVLGPFNPFKGGGDGGGGEAPDISEPIPLSDGGSVPGYAHGGAMDSRRNDTVPAMLSPGEIVLPRSVTLAPDAPERSRAFVAAIQAHRATLQQPDEHHLVREARRKAA